MSFGEDIKRLRGNISVKQVADLIGIDPDRLRKWEERKANPKDSGDIAKIESYFGKGISEIHNLDNFKFIPRETVMNISTQMHGSSSMTAKLEGVNKEQSNISSLIEANLLHANNCARLITLLEERLVPHLEPAKPGAAGHKTYSRKKQGTDSK